MAYVPLHCSFPPSPIAPSKARRATVAWLSDRGVPASAVDAALIVVSELVANGVLHGGDDDVGLRLDIEGDEVCIEVTTAPAAPGAVPVRREPHEAGRGLTMVAACCDGVDVALDDVGNRRVSCRIAMRGGVQHQRVATGRARRL